MTAGIFILLALFGIKHFFADFVLQKAYMVKDKGTYGAPGGIHHAGIHATGTFIVLMLVISHTALVIPLALLDGVIHYHIDWAKQQLNRDLTVKDDMWWALFGLDQALHYLTYVGIIYVIASEINC